MESNRTLHAMRNCILYGHPFAIFGVPRKMPLGAMRNASRYSIVNTNLMCMNYSLNVFGILQSSRI